MMERWVMGYVWRSWFILAAACRCQDFFFLLFSTLVRQWIPCRCSVRDAVNPWVESGNGELDMCMYNSLSSNRFYHLFVSRGLLVGLRGMERKQKYPVVKAAPVPRFRRTWPDGCRIKENKNRWPLVVWAFRSAFWTAVIHSYSFAAMLWLPWILYVLRCIGISNQKNKESRYINLLAH